MHEHITVAYGRIQPYILKTPFEVSHVFGAQVYLKHEHAQRTGSFKIRGAMNKMLVLGEAARDGVICASTGNHGLAVSYAGHLLKIPVTVYLPEATSPTKIAAIRHYGGKIITVSGDGLAAELKAREIGGHFISPYNDIDVIHGQGTIALEMVAQNPRLDVVFVAVGGGGLISGVGSYLKAVNPAIQVIGCWPENATALYTCLQAGKIIDVSEQPTLSEATAGGIEPGSITFDSCRQVLDEAVLVSEAEIRQAMCLVAEQEHWMIEGAAGVAVAAFLKTADRWRNKTVGIILCGRNIGLKSFCDVANFQA